MGNHFLEEFTSQTDTMMTFIMMASDDILHTHEYGSGDILTMVEMHTLALIADNPGICISDIARSWNRTLGAISQIVNNLHKKGYIEKKKLPTNKKTIHLYSTEKGQLLADLHKDSDQKKWQDMLEEVLENHSFSELRTFLNVMNSFVEAMQKRKDL